MSLTVTETTEETDLTGTLPCECFLTDGSACGRPADFRLLSRCDRCRDAVSGFICAPCWDYLRPYIACRKWACRRCGAPRMVRES